MKKKKVIKAAFGDNQDQSTDPQGEDPQKPESRKADAEAQNDSHESVDDATADLESDDCLETPDSITVSLTMPRAYGNGTRKPGEKLCTITLADGVTLTEVRTALMNQGALLFE